MSGKRSPRGPWLVVAALALVLGVGLLSPAWAADPGSTDTGTALVPPPRGNSPGGSGGGGGGGEADPDWWQTDGWSGTSVIALPAHDDRTLVPTQYRSTTWFGRNYLDAFVNWLLYLSSHRLGI
jgi:hypothetical protein